MFHCQIFFGSFATARVARLDSCELKKNLLAPIFFLQQQHSTEGIVVTSSASFPPAFSFPGDFIITTVPQVPIGILTADCLPLVLHAPSKGVVGVVHAGWRGAIAGIVQTVIARLYHDCKVEPHELVVYFGPAARACCYEVQADFVARVQTDQLASTGLVRREGRLFFDVSDYTMICLTKLGIPPKQICRDNNMCTICDVRFCSYRRHGDRTRLQHTTVTLI